MDGDTLTDALSVVLQIAQIACALADSRAARAFPSRRVQSIRALASRLCTLLDETDEQCAVVSLAEEIGDVLGCALTTTTEPDND